MLVSEYILLKEFLQSYKETEYKYFLQQDRCSNMTCYI